MSVTLTENTGAVIMAGNPAMIHLEGTECYTSMAVKGTNQLTLPFPATYEPYSEENDPAFTFETDVIGTLDFYCKNDPVHNGYNLDLAVNFNTEAEYLADCLARLKENPYLQQYYVLSISGSYINLTSRVAGRDYEITCEALRLIGITVQRIGFYDTAYKNEFYKLGLKLLINSEPEIEVEKSVTPEVDADPYFDLAIADFNISPFIFNPKTGHFSFPNDDEITNHALAIYDTLFMVPFERYGDPRVTYPGLASDIYYFLNGKLKDEQRAVMIGDADEFTHILQITGIQYSTKFLTDQPNPKKIDIYQPEILNWFPVPGADYNDEHTFLVKVKFYYAGSDETVTVAIVVVNDYEIIEIPVNYRFLRQFASEKFYAFDVWIINTYSSTSFVSNVQSFTIDRNYKQNARYFFALNHYGVYECFRTTGLAEKTGVIEKEIIDISNDETDNELTDRKKQLDESRLCTYKLNIGYMDKFHADWMLDLMESRHTVIIKESICYPVKIYKGKYTTDKDKESFQNFAFEFEAETDIVENVQMPQLPDSQVEGFNGNDTNKDFGSFSNEALLLNNLLLAGTSASSLVLSSTNRGFTWSNENVTAHGSPTCFCEASTGDVYYGTYTGWLVNFTKREYVKISDYPILCLLDNSGALFAGTGFGDCIHVDYDLNIESTTPTGGSICYDIIYNGNNLVFFTSDGIINGYSSAVIQAGDFNCVCDLGSGIILAIDTVGSLWISTNNCTSFTENGLIDSGYEDVFIKIIKVSTELAYVVSPACVYQMELTTYTAEANSAIPAGDIVCAAGPVPVPYTNLIIGANNGRVYRHDVENDTWFDTGQQLSQSSITGLFFLAEYILPEVTPPVSETIIYAGTSPGALILQSVNEGVNWTNLGSAGKGNPLAFCQLSNGDLLYTTDTGYVVNHTQETSVKVSDYPIRAVFDDIIAFSIHMGDDNGDLYYIDYLFSFVTAYLSLESQINAIFSNDPEVSIIYFTESGIFTNDVLVQAGNFTCGVDAGGGVLYAGSADGHIWKSVDSGVNWSDLGVKTDNTPNSIFLLLNNRIGLNCTSQNSPPWFLYTDDNFSTMNGSDGVNQGSPISGVIVGDKVILGNTDGGFYLSIDNGENFAHSDQQFSQTSINCLIKIQT